MLATIADYEMLTGTDVPTDQETRLAALLDATSTAIKTITSQELELVTDETIVVCVAPGTSTILLPEVPVSAVEVTGPDGVVIPEDHYTLDPKAGTLKHCDCRPWAAGEHSITYSHGYDPIPADLVAYTVAATRRAMMLPTGVTQQSVGSYSVSYGDGAGVGSAVLDLYSVPV